MTPTPQIIDCPECRCTVYASHDCARIQADLVSLTAATEAWRDGLARGTNCLTEVPDETATWRRFAEALADELILVGRGRRELLADADDSGRDNDRLDGRVGRCSRPLGAIRWEYGFLDKVCAEHGANAAERGALVVTPRRHDGTDL